MKMVEDWHPALFTEAYEAGTGQRLTRVQSGERPDFVCLRPNGRLVGVELTQVFRDSDIAFADRILHGRETGDPYDTSAPLQPSTASPWPTPGLSAARRILSLPDGRDRTSLFTPGGLTWRAALGLSNS
jgi:hypothetical protein